MCPEADRESGGVNVADNQRVRLSKQLLRQSLIELLDEKSIHKVSVREICDRAQVNRSTFYKYYGSQYDLLKEMESEILQHIDEQLSKDPVAGVGDLSQITKIVVFVGENAPLCRALINHNVDPKFPDALISMSYLRDWIDAHFASQYSKAEMEYIYGLVVNGGFTVIKLWINKDDREPPEFIAALLSRTIARLFLKTVFMEGQMPAAES